MSENDFIDIGFAKLDIKRHQRTGMNETVSCLWKTNEQLLKIFKTFDEQKISVLGTRCSQEQFDYLNNRGLPLIFDPVSKTLVLKNKETVALNGKIAVCTAGTADLPVAEEAGKTAEFFGAKVDRHFDVGIAGINRLLAKIERFYATINPYFKFS